MNFNILLYVLLFCIFSISSTTVFAEDVNSTERSSDVFSKSKLGHPKINSELLALNDGSSSQLRTLKDTDTSDAQIHVYIYLREGQEKNIPEDLNILAKSDNIISAKILFSQLESVANLSQVSRIDLPVSGEFFTHVKSEGVSFSFANNMHTKGFTGNGVKVAVIDSGFFTSNPEIASNISFTKNCTALNTITCGDISDDSHGTAVAEIVVDMAPDVELYLYSTRTAGGGVDLVDVLNAVDDAISKDVDIITMSLGFAGIGGDGTSGFEKDSTSSLSKKVNNAKNSGILVTVSAGNGAQGHWSGTYSASSVSPSSIGFGELSIVQSLMNFQPGAVGVQKVCLPVFDFGSRFITQWNDWVFSDQDYDLLLYDPTLLFLHAFSAGDQTGTQFPREIIGSGAPAGFACLVLASFSSTENHFFHIETSNLIDPSVGNADGSISVPAEATGALAVGAIDQSTDQLEPFSSQGPTDDSRLKPEICGPDNTFSHQSGLNPFFGTSASAPHVAGGAALLLDQDPSRTADQLRQKLIDDARFNASYSVNNLCGSTSGALSLQLAAANMAPTVTITSPTSGSNFTEGESILFSGNATDIEDGDISSDLQWTSDLDGLIGNGTSFSNSTLSVGTHAITAFVTDSEDANDSKQIPITINEIPPCSPPISGDWNVTSSCILSENTSINGNVIVQDNSVLEILNGVTLDIDFANFNLTVKSGSGVWIKAGGTIT